MALAYPDYSKEFKIYPDASSQQMGAVFTQQNGGSYMEPSDFV
jgi:hypothetical protein